MNTIEKTGPSVESLIREFCSEHKIKDWELKYTVVKKPSSGFLGLFGSKTAVVRFDLPELADRASLFLSRLLQKMGVAYDKIEAKTEGKSVYLDI
ncbi:MAG TPA: Jag N-terminal domain-containing protein, partial [Candidatus Syntrophosphaera sp.]|nr:Jag N-terminal domain-containing protein [Candidatus Syntrophosphaera sp.]